MNTCFTFGIIFLILLFLETTYFRVAKRHNIFDKSNSRSSHLGIVIRGGGVIFVLSAIVWAGAELLHVSEQFTGLQTVLDYLPFLCGLCLITSISFIDDIRSLPNKIRLAAQFVAMGLTIYNLNMMHFDLWWVVIIALVIFVGAANVVNFMDGINGITAGYSLTVLVPMAVMNMSAGGGFIDQNFLYVIILGVLVFCIFNFRPCGKAKCFAGDVGSIGIAFIMLFAIGKLIMHKQDMTYLIFLMIYGIDGVLTILHRIMLHENLGEAHRKHAYQIMANELRIGHVRISLLYMSMQLIITLGFIYLCPDTLVCHWMYFLGTIIILSCAYVAFMRKYYHLHEEYLASLK